MNHSSKKPLKGLIVSTSGTKQHEFCDIVINEEELVLYLIEPFSNFS